MLRAMSDRPVSTLNKPDAALELTLRPALFSDFTGQPKDIVRCGQRGSPADRCDRTRSLPALQSRRGIAGAAAGAGRIGGARAHS
jgi:hypothetical protein